MDAAVTVEIHSLEDLSPELVLVDSLLASAARALLPDPSDTLVRVERPVPEESVPPASEVQVAAPTHEREVVASDLEAEHTGVDEIERSPLLRLSPFPFSFPDDGRFVGVREAAPQAEMNESELEAEVIGALTPSATGFRRVTTLIPSTSAALAVALLVFQLYVSPGAFG